MSLLALCIYLQEDFKNLDSYAAQLGWYALFAKKDKNKKGLLNCNGSGKLVKKVFLPRAPINYSMCLPVHTRPDQQPQEALDSSKLKYSSERGQLGFS